jgi:hypothetical protein
MPIPEKRKPKKRLDSFPLLKYSGMGLQMAAVMLAGAWAGNKLDEFWSIKNHLLTAAGVVLGLFVGMYSVIKDLLKQGPKKD